MNAFETQNVFIKELEKVDASYRTEDSTEDTDPFRKTITPLLKLIGMRFD